MTTRKPKSKKRPPLKVGDVLDVPMKVGARYRGYVLLQFRDKPNNGWLADEVARKYRRLPKKGGRRDR